MLSTDVSSLRRKKDDNENNCYLMRDQYVPDIKLSAELNHSIVINQIQAKLLSYQIEVLKLNFKNAFIFKILLTGQ